MVVATRAILTAATSLLAASTSTNCFRLVHPIRARSLTTIRRMSTESSTVDIGSNLEYVRDRVKAVSVEGRPVRLVAVSKTKPIELLQQAYDAGQRVFGENYVQELVDKVPQLPSDVTWHFIGPLQSNKANLLVGAFGNDIQRLTIETVASTKLANKLNKAVQDKVESGDCLRVMVQVNTSGEDTKSGLEAGSELIDLCKHIVNECPRLKIVGLMTIGAPGDDTCFDRLVAYRQQVQDELGLEGPIELSMGMSGDFEVAIQKGATNVRVGSTIFGERDYSNK